MCQAGESLIFGFLSVTFAHMKRCRRLVDKQNVSERTYDQAFGRGKGGTASVAAAKTNEAAEQA